MIQLEFIQNVAKYVQKYAPQFGISVCSPIIAQAILESSSGTSELATNAHNYFGLKYRKNRCPSSCGFYYKKGSEQNKNGTYTVSNMKWMKFTSMELGIKGYFEFINVSNYSNLKGVTNPKTYLENIKKDGYATSLNYVSNLTNIINKYELKKYDDLSSIKRKNDDNGGLKMNINIHAGHNPDGKVACGAIGLIKESTEARKVKDEVIKLLKTQGHTVYDCTVNDGTSKSNVLSKIVKKCNSHSVDIDVSIHFNSGVNDKLGNGYTTGVEVLVYNSSSKVMNEAERICKKISALGFKNRGIKTRSDLYVLKKTHSPALLIECCFVDDADDVKKYHYKTMAKAIVEGILNKEIKSSTMTTDKESLFVSNPMGEFKVKVIDNDLNIRAGAGTTYKIVGSIKNKGTYTITEVSGSWGKLKSGIGWINISTKYVKYV